MNFKVIENDVEINCEIVLTFRDDNNDRNYIVYTDGTKDEDGDLEIYASRYIMDNNNFILNDIEYDYEWDLIDNMLDAKYKEFEE